MRPTVGSLFAGIGGMDLGLERAGWEVRWQVEIDPFRRAVLEKHWPGVKRYGDVRTINPAELEPVDLVAAGPPCQPVSLAGKRRGKEDDRWLWGEALRIVAGLRPRWCLFENPPGFVSMGLDDVLSELEGLGYSCRAFVIPACAVGAPHRRDRVWIVAYSFNGRPQERWTKSIRSVGRSDDTREETSQYLPETKKPSYDVAYSAGVECKSRAEEQGVLREVPGNGGERNNAGGSGKTQSGEDVAYAKSKQNRWLQQGRFLANIRAGSLDVAYANKSGLQGHGKLCECTEQPLVGKGSNAVKGTRLTESGLGRVFDGPTSWLDRYRWPAPLGCEQYDWEPPRLAQGKIPHRRERLMALGDAVVPQVVEAIGRAILEAWAKGEEA